MLNRLCHLLVLTKEGKVEEASDNLLLSLLVLVPHLEVRGPSDAAAAVRAELKVELPRDLLQRSLDRLASRGRLLRAKSAEPYRVSPSARADVLQRIDAALTLEHEVKDEWLASLGTYSPEMKTKLWATVQAYAAEVFLRHGAETAQLLDASLNDPRGATKTLSSYLEEARRQHCPELSVDEVRQLVEGFFTTHTPRRARYVAQMLDAAFTVYALAVDKATTDYLQSSLSPVAVFLDTNFIFGLLEIHSNPLLELCPQIVATLRDNHFPIKQYYHPETLRELRRTIDAIGSDLQARKWQQSMSRLAARSEGVSGLERRFHELNGKAPTDPGLFMSQYDDLPGLLAEFGAEPWPTPLNGADDVYARGEQVADYKEYLHTRKPPREKPYEAINHDIAVLRTVEELRETRRSGGTLDAGAVFLTADLTFSRYVRERFRAKRESSPVILPNQFLQLLRPFIPSTEQFDRQFVEAFALPQFRAIGVDYSSTTSSVLQFLNTVRDMNEQTAARLLANRLLMESLRGVDRNSSKFEKLIETALMRDNATLLEEREAARLETREAKDLAAALDRDKKAAVLRVAYEQDQREREASALLKQIDEHRTDLETERRANALRIDQLEQERSDRERRIARLRVAVAVMAALVGVVLIWCLPALLDWQWLLRHPHKLGIMVIASLSWAALSWWSLDWRRNWVGFATAAVALLVGAAAIIDR